jgi:hypothetical protein
MPVPESDVDHLYGLPLDRFVAERKELARRLKAAGDAEASREASALPRPALAAWALNQIVRREPKLVGAVLASLDRQRELQLGALHGRLDAAALEASRAAEKQALARVKERAAAILDEGGHAPGKTNLDRVLKALRAAALEPTARTLLERGRLTAEESEAGFEAVASQLDPDLLLAALRQREAAPAPAARSVDDLFARSARAAAPAAEPARERNRVQREADRRAEDGRRRESQKRDKAERLARARAELDELRAGLATQERDADRAEARAAELERELEAARTEARRARRKAAQLRVEVDEAEKRTRILGD